jgi:hypothetical protein
MLSTIRPRLLERRAGYFRAEAEVLATVIEEGSRSGAFAVGAPLEAAETLVTATNSLLPYSLSPRELGRRSEIARRTEAIADLVVAGLISRGAPPVRRHRPTLRSTAS